MYVCMYVCIYPEVHDSSPTHISVSRVPWPSPTVLQSTVGRGHGDNTCMSLPCLVSRGGDMYV